VPPLWIGVTLAVFQSPGTIPDASEHCMILVSGGVISSFNSAKSLGDMLPEPGALSFNTAR